MVEALLGVTYFSTTPQGRDVQGCRRLCVVARGGRIDSSDAGEECIPASELKRWVRSGSILKRLRSYDEARLVVNQVDLAPRPVASGLLLRALARGSCRFEDGSGKRYEITPAAIARLSVSSLRARIGGRAVERRVRALLERLRDTPPRPTPKPASGSPRQAIYVYSDLPYGLAAGGSVGHVAGVLNHLEELTSSPPIFLTTTIVPTISTSVRVERFTPRGPWERHERLALRLNEEMIDWAKSRVEGVDAAFVYHRLAVNSLAGLALSRALAAPFVLEYNGSEVWVHRHWGRRLRGEALAAEIEDANLRSADVVVAVSRTLGAELVERGVATDKILVNPNGVDPERYHPGVDGSAVRARHGLDGKLVVGFIGTFGRWHGAEVLAEAFGRLLERDPRRRESVRLLLIGDGLRLQETRACLRAHGAEAFAVFTGEVPQEAGAEHLAACDLLASPHVPNPDGSPFFGSPTKLFEYMAMGKAIVASRLGQIGETLADGETAVLVEPAAPDALAGGMARLLDDSELRARLGASARRRAVASCTWREHTQRIVNKVRECSPCR
jgi:glycosyltransferase involved in cell wall biosynthesis